MALGPPPPRPKNKPSPPFPRPSRRTTTPVARGQVRQAEARARDKTERNPLEPLIVRLIRDFTDARDLSDRLARIFKAPRPAPPPPSSPPPGTDPHRRASGPVGPCPRPGARRRRRRVSRRAEGGAGRAGRGEEGGGDPGLFTLWC